jgi:hypothetical protein
MKRRLLNLLTALSLLLCVAVVGLWVRSYWAKDAVWWSPEPDRSAIIAVSTQGSLVWQHVQSPNRRGPLVRTAGFGHESGRPENWNIRPQWINAGWWELAGLAYGRSASPSYRAHLLRLPWWFPCLMTALLPLARLTSHARRRSRGQGRVCPVCGYDLRATPGRCPECGREATEPTGSPSTSPQTTLLPRS